MSTTQNQLISSQNPGALQYFKAGADAHLPQGTLAFFDSGYLTEDAGGNSLAGIVKNEVNNSGGAPGDTGTEVFMEGRFLLEGSGFSQATVGQAAYGIDNNTVTVSASGNSLIGRFTEYYSPTKAWVKLDMQQA